MDLLAKVTLWTFAVCCCGAIVFAAIAWPVFGIPEPTIGVLIAVPVFGSLAWALWRYSDA